MSSYFWQGKFVRLRATRASDWESHYLWNQDSDMLRRLDHLYFPQTKEEARQWAEQASTTPADKETFHFEIENLIGGAVGSIATHHCDPRNGTFSYGVGILAQHQRQGYATEAIFLVLKYYFEELRYQKVTVDIYDFNEPSLELHRSLGFQDEGRLRRMFFTNGHYHDKIVMGLTSEEFQVLKLSI